MRDERPVSPGTFPDLDAALLRFARATIAAADGAPDVAALRASCADVPRLVFELQDRRRGRSFGSLTDSWVQFLAQQIDYELYRIRVAAAAVLKAADERAIELPESLLEPMRAALAFGQPPAAAPTVRARDGRKVPSAKRDAAETGAAEPRRGRQRAP